MTVRPGEQEATEAMFDAIGMFPEISRTKQQEIARAAISEVYSIIEEAIKDFLVDQFKGGIVYPFGHHVDESVPEGWEVRFPSLHDEEGDPVCEILKPTAAVPPLQRVLQVPGRLTKEAAEEFKRRWKEEKPDD